MQINQRLYLLSQLKSQGMNVQALQTLFTGLIMSKITYALPSFAGQLTADDRNRIGAISRKAQRRGVSCTDFDIDDLIDSVDRKLFSHITDPNHCLYNTIQYNIRLLHRSQTATTSNMKQMNTKYNYLIVETKE